MNKSPTSSWTLVALALGLTACSGAWYPGAIDRPLRPGDRIADGRRHIRFDLRGHHGQKVDLTLSAGDASCRVHGRLDGDIHQRGRDGRLQVPRACVLVGPFDERPNQDLRLRGTVVGTDGSRTAVDWRRDDASLKDVYDSSIVIDSKGKAAVVIALACPWVFAWDGCRWQRRVEIIQQLVGREARRTQRVALGAVAVIDGRVRLRLVEGKPEIARLDRLLLVVAGRKLAPVGRPELARSDGRDLVLEQGDSRLVEYQVFSPDAAHPPRIQASIEATGHYDPAW